MSYPAIPAVIDGMLGPIDVVRVAGLKDDEGEFCNGYWQPTHRRISIEDALHISEAWFTLYHELAHAIIADMAVRGLPDEMEEEIADALGVYLTQVLLGRIKLVPFA